jgi:subtilisin family serine protease
MACSNWARVPVSDRGILGNTAFSYPASYDSVVSVAAVDSAMAHANFSQVNGQVEISAPGVSVLSTMDTAAALYGGVSQLALQGAQLESRTLSGSPEGDITAPSFDCGTAASTCTGATGKVCLIQRGGGTFASKVLNCQGGGGVAAVVYNNLAGFFDGTLGGTPTTIPSLATSDAIGAQLVASVGSDVTVLIDGSAPYTAISGTSMATPHVAGGAALLWSNFPTVTNQEIRNALNASALDLGAAGRDNTFGFGLLQLADANALLGPPALCTLSKLKVSPTSPKPAGTSVQFTAVSDGCADPIFRFSYRLQGGGAWTVVQNGPDDSAELGLSAGAYKVRAQVKEHGTPGWADKKAKNYTWQ